MQTVIVSSAHIFGTFNGAYLSLVDQFQANWGILLSQLAKLVH